MRTYFYRTLAIVVVGYVLVFAGEFYFELWRAGFPAADHTSWVEINNAKLVDLLSPIARAYNNILAMLIATIGLAIPLTANMHTPKLIEMFLRDRLNQLVLFTGAFLAANVLWVDYIVGPHFAPTIAIAIAVGGALSGWALLIPYFFYVVRFLDPTNILKRLETETERVIDDVAAGRLDPDAGQALVHDRLQEIGTIVVKSLDRTDRDIAMRGIWTFKCLLDYHGARKAKMPPAWFEVDRADFVGLSPEALQIVQKEKIFFERKVEQQFFYAYSHAVGKAPDVVSSISDANRLVAVGAAKRKDEAALTLALRCFNNFLRESIRLKHVHSIFDVFLQYRDLAEELHDRPEVVRDIARFLATYALEARRLGVHGVSAFAVFDLADIAMLAVEKTPTVADQVLGSVLSIGWEGASHQNMIVEARVKLGAMLLAAGNEPAATRVKESLTTITKDVVKSVAKDLLDSPATYHEVTDRQVDVRFIPDDTRPFVDRFVALCTEA